VLDNGPDFTFDGARVVGSEDLTRQGAGTATLIASHGYDAAATTCSISPARSPSAAACNEPAQLG